MVAVSAIEGFPPRGRIAVLLPEAVFCWPMEEPITSSMILDRLMFDPARMGSTNLLPSAGGGQIPPSWKIEPVSEARGRSNRGLCSTLLLRGMVEIGLSIRRTLEGSGVGALEVWREYAKSSSRSSADKSMVRGFGSDAGKKPLFFFWCLR